jgi:hypothetical protein
MSKKRSYSGVPIRVIDYCLALYGNNPTLIALHLGITQSRAQRAIARYCQDLRVPLYSIGQPVSLNLTRR